MTFGGGGLDRASGIRMDAPRMGALLTGGKAQILPMWRGKPLIADEGRNRLGLVPHGHPVLAEMRGAPVFLGFLPDSGAPVFAADMTGWEPTGVDAAATAAFFDPSEQHHPALPMDHRFAELRGVMARLTPVEAEIAATARGILTWHETHGHCARCGAGTEPEAAGWQRRCTACGAHHFPRTDPVVIMLITRGNEVLLGRSHGWPEGMYSCLAGFVEPGETIEAAVRREVEEETGVRVGAVRYLASQPWPFPASLMFGCAGEAETAEIRVDPNELESAQWVTREDMVAVMAGIHPGIRAPRQGAIAHYLLAMWLAGQTD
ncbi:NAD(+) diphosphatase [Xinfangfangia sp. LG-4]|uniref:NAD(+) diphosphatase n=2 Tax=Ruixingdingia sedimenti TaxID=3073604 RepID=A0ABU1F5R8_9RHOB|nr:NAD(+) diphosphatase [Xinfangfangia sp. LG-4]